MYYDLDLLEEYCEELGFSSARSTPDSLKVKILEGIDLEFHNLRDTEDTIAGFKGTPSHWHGPATLNISDATYVELDELDIVKGLKGGDIVIVERYLNGHLKDRWIAHKAEKMDVQYIEAGEEIRIHRLPQR
jgi:hypothetical protein